MSFDARTVALELVTVLAPVVVAVQRRDRATASQLRRAASAVLANTAEGRRRAGADRLHSFRLALAEADETSAWLETAVAWSYASRASVEPALALADRLRAMLWRLANPRR